MIIEHYLSDGNGKYISDGQRSFTDHSNVQDFLMTKFGFRKAYLKLHVIFRWYLVPFVAMLSLFENRIRNNKLRSFVRLYKWSR